jgi:hypothetical protein
MYLHSPVPHPYNITLFIANIQQHKQFHLYKDLKFGDSVKFNYAVNVLRENL